MGQFRGEEIGRKLSESSREELDEKRRPKRLTFSVGELSIDPLRTNKRRKGRFAKFVRDIFS